MSAMKNPFLFSKISGTLLVLLILFAGCEQELAEIDEGKVAKKLSNQELQLINSTNRLSFDILKSEYQQKKSENFFFSPVSTGIALGMLYNTVGENEKSQIQQLTGLESLVEKEINKTYNEFLSFIQLSSDQMNLTYANSIWFSDDVEINEYYRTKVMAYYDAEISEINFKKKSSLQYINSWGELKTSGTVGLLSSSSPLEHYSVYFVNAFGLQTAWAGNRQFTDLGYFTDLDGRQKEISLLKLEEVNAKTFDHSEYQFIEFPLKKEQYQMSIVLPDMNKSFDEVLEYFNLEELKWNKDNAKVVVANLEIPELDFHSENNLKSTLQNIGLTKLFSSQSDLSPAFAGDAQSISEINQVAKIKISRSASLSLSKDFSNPGLTKISLNKPFLYFISDKHTKSVLFAGFYTSPE